MCVLRKEREEGRKVKGRDSDRNRQKLKTDKILKATRGK